MYHSKINLNFYFHPFNFMDFLLFKFNLNSKEIIKMDHIILVEEVRVIIIIIIPLLIIIITDFLN